MTIWKTLGWKPRDDRGWLGNLPQVTLGVFLIVAVGEPEAGVPLALAQGAFAMISTLGCPLLKMCSPS